MRRNVKFPFGWCSVTSQLFIFTNETKCKIILKYLMIYSLLVLSPTKNFINILIQKGSQKNRCFDISITIYTLLVLSPTNQHSLVSLFKTAHKKRAVNSPLTVVPPPVNTFLSQMRQSVKLL
jgi:hypothetical protein